MTTAAETDEPLTIDDLARRVQLPVRTIREYHTMRLLPPPERRGRLRPHGEDHFLVRSPALLGLVADWVRAGVPLDEVLDLIEVLADDLGALARKLADLIVERVWEPVSAAGRAGELPD